MDPMATFAGAGHAAPMQRQVNFCAATHNLPAAITNQSIGDVESPDDFSRDHFAFSLKICLDALLQWQAGGRRFAARVSTMSSHHPDSTPSGQAPSRPPAAALDHVEYIVRPCKDSANNADNETWLIEHAGGSYGPYKNCREATFFAIDAARKLCAQGKSTRVKAIDHAGHLLTTWKPS